MNRKIWVAGAAVLVAAIGGVIIATSAGPATPAPRDPAASTAKVERGPLAALVTQVGTLTYRARSDGSPFPVINQAGGVYTRLPESGDRVDCGGVLYRVDDRPVLLLCGPVPVYRELHTGLAGQDVRQLNRNLRQLGYDVRIDPGDSHFTAKTEKALRALQHAKGLPVTGALAIGDAVFQPESMRVARVIGELGGPARAGAAVLNGTSGRLHVQLTLDPSQQGEVRTGDRAQIILPGNTPVSGRVEGFGRVAQAPAGPGGKPADATVATYLSIDDPSRVSGLDQAPVQVEITTKGVADALSVPVTALVGKAGDGYAVEVVRDGGRSELVAVKLGLFDTAGGRVQVEGAVRVGDAVVVPADE